MSNASMEFDSTVGRWRLEFSKGQVSRSALVDKPGETSGEVPAWGRALAERVQAHCDGTPQDFRSVNLDLSYTTPFRRKVYECSREVLAGSVVSYGELARRAGSEGGSRAVGSAMATNRHTLFVPCHRVLAGQNKLGGFSAPGGLRTKTHLLGLESAPGFLHPHGSFHAARGARLLDRNEAVRHLSSVDPVLGGVIEAVGPYAIPEPRASSPYQSLARSIVYQQLTGKAAATIASRVCALHDEKEFPPPERVLSLGESVLRSTGLSAAKVRAFQDLAARAKAGEIPGWESLLRKDNEAIIEQLTAVRGVGRWTVEMLLLFELGRPDVFPETDFGVASGLRLLLGRKENPKPSVLSSHAERWAPYRSVASWYLWRAVELGAERVDALRVAASQRRVKARTASTSAV